MLMLSDDQIKKLRKRLEDVGPHLESAEKDIGKMFSPAHGAPEVHAHLLRALRGHLTGIEHVATTMRGDIDKLLDSHGEQL